MPKPSTPRIPQLDGIRGTAILLVVVFHYLVTPVLGSQTAGPITKALGAAGALTWSGVDLFFVLSGFLIGGILIDAKETQNYFQTFYIRRVFRILPIYFLLVLGYFAISAVVGHHSVGLWMVFGVPIHWYTYASFTQNFWVARHGWVGMYLQVSWSLAVEEQFYLVLPAIIRFSPRKALLPFAICLAAASALLRSVLYLHYGPDFANAAAVLIYCRADSLMLGVVSALILRDPALKKRLQAHPRVLSAAIVFLGAGVALLTAVRWWAYTPEMSTFGYTWLAAFYASVLMASLLFPQGRLSRLFQTKWLISYGTIAYGLYLCHMGALDAVFRVFRHQNGSEPFFPRLQGFQDLLALAGSFILATVICQISWKFFEAPLVGLGHRFHYKSRTGHERVPVAMPSELPLEKA